MIRDSMPDSLVIPVDVQGHAYRVVIGAMDSLGRTIRSTLSLAPDARPLAVVVTNTKLVDLLAGPILNSLSDAGFRPIVATFDAGESHKNLASVQHLFDQILPHKPERGTPVIAVGGGIVTDVAGFVSATLLRGTPLISVPTTLLAMVDSSVGGKTGVNHASGKNLIGSFHQPTLVYIDPASLGSLPPRELSAGLAECVKHDLIRDAGHFDQLPALIPRIRSLEPVVAEFIAHNVRIKAKVVEEDPFERGVRAHLNLGHTFGHAYETVSDYKLLHGECVALGIVSAAFISSKLGLISVAQQREIADVLLACGLPTKGQAFAVESVLGVMRNDKKVQGGRIRLVLLDGIGKAVVRDDVPEALIRDAIAGVG